tara:strand:+ start:522 stop:2288 length:1767 start_codon:yes stop_codon:yes gene_type:complete
MRNLKLLNKKYLSILIFSLFTISPILSEEPVDIWKIEKKEKLEKNDSININNEEDKSLKNDIYEMQSLKEENNNIFQDETLVSKEIKIFGLYDPEENGLDINMWSNSNGEHILNLFKSINKINLSKDASEIFNILLLTNSYYPDNNITKDQFLKIKSDWLIKNSNLNVIEDYLIKNQIVNENPELMKFLVDQYLSRSNIKKSCEIFSKFKKAIDDEYLSKFNIYCLINNEKKNEAQLLIDLKKELGFKDDYYEDKINYLLGYKDNVDKNISENSILNFHLAHRTNPNFKFIPNDKTSKLIWKYLSTSNLLDRVQDIEVTDLEKILIIEKATHNQNYTEEELFELYKKFQFNINQLLNIKESYKLLPNVESRALIYQGILITTDIPKKIELIKILKDSFIKENKTNAFDEELRKILEKIEPDKVPSKYSSFFDTYIKDFDEKTVTNIKINNKILHQSKLINYFSDDYSTENVEKDLNDLLKKIKRDKKYFFSKKDIILVESLKADGIKVSDKFKNLYKIEEAEMPKDIRILIDNKDIGGAMLRIVQVIGQDLIKDIDDDTIYFIVKTLNELNIDNIRNKLLLKVLPLKV